MSFFDWYVGAICLFLYETVPSTKISPKPMSERKNTHINFPRTIRAKSLQAPESKKAMPHPCILSTAPLEMILFCASGQAVQNFNYLSALIALQNINISFCLLITGPGTTAFITIPFSPNNVAKLLIALIIPAFYAPYQISEWPICPAIEAVVGVSPTLCRFRTLSNFEYEK